MSGPELEAMRYAEAEWKAGYAAATRHRRWTVAAVIAAGVLVLRRRGFPLVAAVLWVAIGCVALWPVVVVGLMVEHRRRRKVRAAIANTEPEPFPTDDGPTDDGLPGWAA
jgi:hypothetical protein